MGFQNCNCIKTHRISNRAYGNMSKDPTFLVYYIIKNLLLQYKKRQKTKDVNNQKKVLKNY